LLLASLTEPDMTPAYVSAFKTVRMRTRAKKHQHLGDRDG
jgi:hypothetical protein